MRAPITRGFPLLRAHPFATSATTTASRALSTFAELYRDSVDSAPVRPGDVVRGRVVGATQPRSTSSRFYIVDFGLKNEVPFTPREIPGRSTIGSSLELPLVALEDDFNEPVVDHDNATQLPMLQAERYSLLTAINESKVGLFHGRFTRFNRGGAGAKLLGVNAFVPKHHVLALESPVLGTFAPFYVLSMTCERASSHTSHSSLNIHPVVSSYGGILFCLANLLAFDDKWKESGGGSAHQRLAYLRLLTRVLQQKNPTMRRILPKSSATNDRRRSHQKRDKPRRSQPDHVDTAWLNELPRHKWASSGRDITSSTLQHKQRNRHLDNDDRSS